MPWIETLHEEEWKGDLGDMKDRVIDPTYQRVDWIFRIHSLDAGSMDVHLGLYQQAMKGTRTLRKVEREMIALVVSTVNECHY
jgi:alkylhydroperoxidase family enzyme